MKETILSLHPKRSNSSTILGNTASELVVAKAIDTGSAIACKNFLIGTPNASAMGNKITNKKTIKRF